jgi:hypothetical protein
VLEIKIKNYEATIYFGYLADERANTLGLDADAACGVMAPPARANGLAVAMNAEIHATARTMG